MSRQTLHHLYRDTVFLMAKKLLTSKHEGKYNIIRIDKTEIHTLKRRIITEMTEIYPLLKEKTYNIIDDTPPLYMPDF